MKCVNVLGGSSKSRLDCASTLARMMSDRGWRVTYLAPWNRSGDPDPYQSSPFHEMHLVSPEADLSYMRPGSGIEAVMPSVSGDWLIVDGIPVEGALVVACDDEQEVFAPIASFGVSIPGVQSIEDGEFTLVLERIHREDAGGRCRGGSPADRVEVSVSGRTLDLSGFPSRVVESVVIGLVSSLRGYSERGDVIVIIRRE